MPSSYLLKLRTAVQNGIQKTTVGKDGTLAGPVEFLVEQGRHWFGSARFFHSGSFPGVSDLQLLLPPGVVLAARSDSQLANQRRNLSVVGALSRTFSTPSVSGPSFQICAYHVDRALSEAGQSVDSCKPQDKPMAACGSRTVLSDCRLDNLISRCQHNLMSTNHACYGNKNFDSCQRASMSLKKERPSKYQIYGYLAFSALKGKYNSDLYFESGVSDLYAQCCRAFSTGTAPDVSFDKFSGDEQLGNSTLPPGDTNLPLKSLKLLSGSCYLPHPDKEETGGEDAHFICADEQAIGVADGVGGWADYGIDAGQYSRELMSNSIAAVQEEPKGSINPFRVLEKAYSSTKAQGSSTACIIALTDQGLHAINLGDSGFMVVRDGCTIFRSPVQQHDFNQTYQLGGGNSGDLPSSGQVFTIPVAPGDVIIAGTDGLFDNLYNNEITAVVVHATRAGLGPQVTAQKIAALARQRAQDRDRQTPFSTAAQDAGIRYYGGKLDDITVIVSYITGSRDEKQLSA